MTTPELALFAGCLFVGFIWSFVIMRKPKSYGVIPQNRQNEQVVAALAWWQNLPYVQSIKKRTELKAARVDCLVNFLVFLDILNLGLSAGMSFDAALDLYCSKFHNDLSVRLQRSLLSWQIGEQSRTKALRALAQELDLQPVTRFVNTVDEALRFGSPLTRVLAAQAELIREEQRNALEEQVEKVPIKMLIPLGTLIVPAMLLAILGPLLSAASGKL